MPDDHAVVGGITRNARLYAIGELFRRAGVSLELYRSWAVKFDARWTVIHVEPGTDKKIRFPNASFLSWEELCATELQVIHAGWMQPPKDLIRNLIPYFVIPFTESHLPAGAPLFQRIDSSCVDCSLDLPLSVLLTLSRFEESQTEERDAHGRFAGTISLAYKHGYLLRPIVDEYGLALEQALGTLLPQWQPKPRKLRTKLSHDVDLVGIPFSLREAVGHTLRRHRPGATFRDLIARFADWSPTYLHLISRIAHVSIARGLDSAFYWAASAPGPEDSGYDPRHQKINRVISWLSEQGIENGAHPGYETYQCRDRLRAEVQILKEALTTRVIGGRQHFLRWCPETWLDWEACGLKYDSTLGFADVLGFRAGTCVPYRPWILSANRELDLLEIPLIVMDRTPIVYMGLSCRESLDVIEACLQACRGVGGVFTLLWHNTTLVDPAFGDMYENILDRLDGSEKFDWKRCLQETW